MSLLWYHFISSVYFILLWTFLLTFLLLNVNCYKYAHLSQTCSQRKNNIISIVARVTCTKLLTSIVVNKPWIPFRPFVFFLWSKVVSDKIVCIWNHCSFLILWLFNLFHLWTPKNWIVILFTNGHTLPFREDMRIWCCIKMKPFSCKVCFFSSLVSSWLSQNCKGKIHVDLFR